MIALYSNIMLGVFPVYKLIEFPVACITILGFSVAHLKNNNIIRYMSSITYAFYLAQLFVWKVTLLIMTKFNITRNRYKILTSLVVCFGIAVIFNLCVERPTRKCLRKLRKAKAN